MISTEAWVRLSIELSSVKLIWDAVYVSVVVENVAERCRCHYISQPENTACLWLPLQSATAEWRKRHNINPLRLESYGQVHHTG